MPKNPFRAQNRDIFMVHTNFNIDCILLCILHDTVFIHFLEKFDLNEFQSVDFISILFLCLLKLTRLHQMPTIILKKERRGIFNWFSFYRQFFLFHFGRKNIPKLMWSKVVDGQTLIEADIFNEW